MRTDSKGMSPFYPGQPVPVELFVGRSAQIDLIEQRGVCQVEHGKPTTFFMQGEYGIGKSSLAHFTQFVAEKEHHLIALYATLGAATTLDHVGEAILQAAAEAGAMDPKKSEKIQNWLSTYVGEQSLFGLTLHVDALKKEGPNIARGPLPFLRAVLDRVQDEGVKGIFLVLDEINGIAAHPQFAHFIKGLVDNNALARKPLPLLLMLCGTEERRRQIIAAHQPVERVFEVVNIDPLSVEETGEFFTNAFRKANMTVEPEALKIITHFSAGLPKVMHLIGDHVFWLDSDGVVSVEDAGVALLAAAKDVGQRYVEQQVYRALYSKDYQFILRALAKLGPSTVFHKRDVEKGLSDAQKKKLNNFLQRMKKLKVLRSGDSRGEYVFNVRMVPLYIWLKETHPPSSS